MGECFLHGQGGAGGGEADTSFKDLVQRTITEVNDNTVASIGEHAFYGCSDLTSVNLPLATSIGAYTFRYCLKLTSVNLPLATSIGAYAFSDCSDLTSVDLPLATSIGNYVFQYCSKLTSLIIRTTSQICSLFNAESFLRTPIASGTGYIYVPSALIEDYKAATNWSTYAAQFRALEDYTVDGTVTGELDTTKI